MTTAELELLAAVELGGPRSGPREGERVRVLYNAGALADGARPQWRRVGPGELVGRVEQITQPGPNGRQGSLMVYGDSEVAALLFGEVVTVEALAGSLRRRRTLAALLGRPGAGP